MVNDNLSSAHILKKQLMSLVPHLNEDNMSNFAHFNWNDNIEMNDFILSYGFSKFEFWQGKVAAFCKLETIYFELHCKIMYYADCFISF